MTIDFRLFPAARLVMAAIDDLCYVLLRRCGYFLSAFADTFLLCDDELYKVDSGQINFRY